MATIFLVVHRGDTKKIPVTAYDVDGEPFNLAQVESITFTVKEKRSDDDEDALISKTLGNGIEVVSELLGTMMVTLDPADTSELEGNRRGLKWDIQMVTLSDEVFTLADGLMNVVQDVTRAI